MTELKTAPSIPLGIPEKKSVTTDAAGSSGPASPAPSGPITTAKEDNITGEPKAGILIIVTAIINGAGIGLLLGVLLGLSISPVVSGVIGILSGLLAVLLGTSEKYMSPLKSVRIGAFGFCCVAGIMLGIHIRTNNAMLPEREKMLHDYMKVGFSKQEALDFIAFREFGLVPAGWKSESKSKESIKSVEPTKAPDSSSGTDQNPTLNPQAVQPSNKPGDKTPVNKLAALRAPSEKVEQKQAEKGSSDRVFANANDMGLERKSVLYSSEVSASDCDLINNAESGQDIDEIKNTFAMAGGTWKELAQNLGGAGLNDKAYIQSLLLVRNCFCESGIKSGLIKVTYSQTLKKMGVNNTLEQIKEAIGPSDEMFFTIKERIGKNIDVGYQRQLYLALIKTFCHE